MDQINKLTIYLFTTFVFVSFDLQAQWQEFSVDLKYQVDAVHWLDSNSLLMQRDYYQPMYVYDYGDISENIYFPCFHSFPLSDTSFVGVKDGKMYVFGRQAQVYKELTPVEQADSSGDGVSMKVVYFDLNHWMCFYERDNGSIVTRLTNDQGNSWNTISSVLPIPDGELFAFFNISNKFHYDVIEDRIWMYASVEPNILHRSDDYGATWLKITLPTWLKPTVNSPFAFANKQTGIFTCFNNGGLAITSDGGETWSSEGLERPERKNSKICFAPASADGRPGAFVIYGQYGSHFGSENGLWWKPIDNLEHSLMSFYDVKHGFSYRTLSTDITNYRFRLLETSANLPTHITLPDDQSLRVYPNPSKGIGHIQMEGSSDVAIYDALGKCLNTWYDVDSNTTLDIRHLAPGVYTLRLLNSGKTIRIIKE